jgi:hypothetical protein
MGVRSSCSGACGSTLVGGERDRGALAYEELSGEGLGGDGRAGGARYVRSGGGFDGMGGALLGYLRVCWGFTILISEVTLEMVDWRRVSDVMD